VDHNNRLDARSSSDKHRPASAARQRSVRTKELCVVPNRVVSPVGLLKQNELLKRMSARHHAVETLESRTLFSGVPSTLALPPSIDTANPWELVALSDGKLLAVAAVMTQNGQRAAVLKFDASGALDETFGTDGVAVAEFDYPGSVALTPDGKIVIAGSATFPGGSDLAVARFTAGGAPDTTFSGDGSHTLNLGQFDNASDVAVDAMGRIVLAGSSDGDMLVARLNADGTNDDSFSGDGFVLTDFGVEEAGA
jgi:uncharacterized delta-60 repeat protein